MAADDAAVVVRLSANLKDYEAALKNAVRATERAAAASEKAMSGIGKGSGGKGFSAINDNFQKSTNQIANDARVLQFQLNDIFSGLATGQGIRAVQQQLGQIAQQMSGGGLVQSAKTLGSAMIGMINPVNLAVVAFGLLATAAASYFGDSEKDTKKLNDELQKHQENIKRIVDNWKEAPAIIKQAVAATEQLQTITERQQATEEQRKTETLPIVDAIKDAIPQIDSAIGFVDRLTAAQRASLPELSKLAERWTKLHDDMQAGKATRDDVVKFMEDLKKAANAELPKNVAKLLSDDMDRLALAINAPLQKIGELDQALEKLGETSKQATDKAVNTINALPLPTLGPPITAGAGVFNPSQQQMEDAKKAREQAERDAKEAQREAERAAEKNKREAERAAKEAADKLNEAIANQTSVAVDAVTGMLGKSETANAGEINAFLKRGGVDIDSATTAWCAAFVNSALAQVGIKGSGSNVATSFSGWGQGVPLGKVQRGDVLVENRGRSAGETGGHVGFATGNLRATADGIQQIEMISGNSANKVQQQWVDATDVIARRSADAFELPAGALKHLSDEASNATAAAKKLSDEQMRNAQRLAQTYNQVGQNAVGGLVSDLMHGATAAEAFNNMLGDILDSLAQIAIQQLFNPTGQKGGLFGALFGIGHGGGNVSSLGAGRQRQVSPLAFAGAPRFGAGGIVGLSPGEVPIIAHRGEVIVPNARRLAGSGRQAPQNFTTSLGDINMDMKDTGLVAADNDSAKQFGVNVQKIVQREMVRESRPGGLLRRVPNG